MKLEAIKTFLNQKNIAVVGVSSKGTGFGVSVLIISKKEITKYFPLTIMVVKLLVINYFHH